MQHGSCRVGDVRLQSTKCAMWCACIYVCVNICMYARDASQCTQEWYLFDTRSIQFPQYTVDEGLFPGA